jgi:predicted DNA-binding protein (MmcQ/YjbR family)
MLRAVEFPDVPGHVLDRVRRLCLALPEAHVTDDGMAYAFRVGRRIFAHLLTVEDPGGRRFDMLVCTADPEERDVLLGIGHPYFAPRSGKDRLGVILEDTTDWTEIAELVTESYRLVAPRRLAAQVDAAPVD